MKMPSADLAASQMSAWRSPRLQFLQTRVELANKQILPGKIRSSKSDPVPRAEEAVLTGFSPRELAKPRRR